MENNTFLSIQIIKNLITTRGLIKMNTMKNLTQTETEKITKEQLKQLKNCFCTNYIELIEEIEKGHIKLDDLQLYIRHFPRFAEVVNYHRRKSAERKKKEEFDKIIQMDKPVAEQYLQDCVIQKNLVSEAIKTLQNKEVYTDSAIQSKNTELLHLEQKMTDLQFTIDCLQSTLKNQTPLKRKVGRPKKLK